MQIPKVKFTKQTVNICQRPNAIVTKGTLLFRVISSIYFKCERAVFNVQNQRWLKKTKKIIKS